MSLKSMIALALLSTAVALPAVTEAQAGRGPGSRVHHHARFGHVRVLPPNVRYVDPRLPRTIVRYTAPRRPDFLIPAYLPRLTEAPMTNEPPARFPQR